MQGRPKETGNCFTSPNATSRLNEDLMSLGIGEHFHAVVNSSVIGVRKPAPKIFQLALEVGGFTAAETLYIDDSARNIDAGDALGLITHRFIDVEQLIDNLRVFHA